MKHTIFGKEIITKDYDCQKNTCNDLWKVKEPYVNVYVKVTEVCQARCKFCEFCDRVDAPFNYHKLYYVLAELQKKVAINKISFTGGELSLYMNKFQDIMKMVREVAPKAFTVVNTNGYNLSAIMQMDEVDNVSLSRHHYDEKKNMETFGIDSLDKLPLNGDFAFIPNKHKIHFSCNLVKGYIDSYEEVCKFLEWAASVGVMDVGFVSLMKVTDFCKENHVDFRDLEIDKNPERIFHYQTWKNKNTCECRNYFYNPVEAEGLVKIYARYNHDYLKGNESNLVFDGDHLRNGFYGDIII